MACVVDQKEAVGEEKLRHDCESVFKLSRRAVHFCCVFPRTAKDGLDGKKCSFVAGGVTAQLQSSDGHGSLLRQFGEK